VGGKKYRRIKKKKKKKKKKRKRFLKDKIKGPAGVKNFFLGIMFQWLIHLFTFKFFDCPVFLLRSTVTMRSTVTS